MSKPGYDFLHAQKLGDVPRSQNQPLVFLHPTDTVECALKKMAENRVLSLPVLDNSHKILAILDGIDILYFALSIQTTISSHNESTISLAGRALALKTVSEIVDLSGRNPLVTVNIHNPVSMAAQIMAGGIHRTPVVDDQDQCLYTFSQSDVVRLLAEHINMGKLLPLGEKTLGQLGFGQGGVATVALDAPILAAMETLRDKGVSAVAVVHENGQLAGNFSSADLKGLYMEKLPDLLKSVKDYLEAYHPESFNCVIARVDTKLSDVVRDLAQNKVHRVWVLNNENQPCGVVSLRDVIDAVLVTVV